MVNGDPVQMRAGDLLLTPSMFWHGHHHVGDEPMAWLDGLDIPLVRKLDAGFFEYGDDGIEDKSTPDRSRSERLWAHPGRRPLSVLHDLPNSPLLAYRWADTDASLTAQLELEDEGEPGVYEPGHAAIRFTNPTTGRDALPTLRTEMHRIRAGATTIRQRTVGSAVWQVFRGRGTAELAGLPVRTGRGRPHHRAIVGPAAFRGGDPARPVYLQRPPHLRSTQPGPRRGCRARTALTGGAAGVQLTELPPWDTLIGWATNGEDQGEAWIPRNV